MASSNSDKRRVLVTGSTGKQGAAVINALLSSNTTFPIQILALTRNVDSTQAKVLAAKSDSVTLVKGDLSDCDAVFAQRDGPIHTVFSVQVNVFGSPQKTQEEVVLAKSLIDAAIANKVQHIVQASGDRGGAERSEWDETPVPHFATKFQIEQYLKEKAEAADISWTVLRPVSFMENYSPDFNGRGFAAMWHGLGDKPLQLVATKDIGIFAAKAILAPEDSRFHNKAISIAGDELTQNEACKVFQKVFHTKMPMIFPFVGNIVQWKIPEVKSMFEWFKKVGFAADVNECKKINENMLDFESWLRQESGFRGWF
ncbi:MAG: hypothetical protein M1821_000786 [Bathelium mastoideum]|nr:MAG: hypothetical protein M1821_000786 [Bathelium mastoideum]